MATPSDAPYKLIQRQPPFSVRSVLEIEQVGRKVYGVDGAGTIRRRFPKVRGKANVKRAKRERTAARVRATA